MIIELSIKKNKSISLFDYIIFSSNYYKALSKKDIYERGVRSKFDVPEVISVRSKRCPRNLCINF
jgi:hypothetical protein